MTNEIALFLLQDGVVNAAIYALIALSLVMIFAVTRILFVAQGEFVAYGALTLADLIAGRFPLTIWLLCGASILNALLDIGLGLRSGRPMRRVMGTLTWPIYSVLLIAVTWTMLGGPLPQYLAIPLTVAIVAPLGIMIYRIAFERIADASVLLLLIVATAVHFVLIGVGLIAFGPEGSRNPPVAEFELILGALRINAQSLWVVGASCLCIAALYGFFDFSLSGKALKAVAINRIGAKLVGVRTSSAGRLTFGIAAAIGAGSGMLVAPITTVYYDTGFLIGLKGFVAAIIGGLVSYPLAAVGALIVGILEAYASFWASAYKEVIVFTLIIPVLIWRSIRTTHFEEE